MAEGHGGDPAQAFEDLRAEVSVLRRAIEALPAAMRETRPPDLSPDLAVLGKGLDEIGEQLDTIMKSPALMMTPAQQGESIARAGNNLVREAAQRLDTAARNVEGERMELSRIIGQAWAQDRQWRLLWLAGGIAFAVGLVVSPLVAGVLPFGLNTRVAALVMREDRWKAGGDLMEAANPSDWSRFVADTRLDIDNQDTLAACRAALAKTGKVQHCTLTLTPPKAPAAAPAAPSPDALPPPLAPSPAHARRSPGDER